MKIAFSFPGLGSQRVGMGRAFAEAVPAARQVFEDADRALGFELSRLCFEGPEEELKQTSNTQPAILATSIAALRAIESLAGGLKPDYVAGHSLGEYTALVAAGALHLGDALRLVRQRGIFMQEAVEPSEGAMAAILGCDTEKVRSICAEAASLGVCAPANLNSRNQTVIAGHKAAIERAVELARAAGARKTVMLAVSAPFHCELMGPAARKLAPVLDGVRFADLKTPLVTNVDAEPIRLGIEAKDALLRQVASPVRWNESVIRMLENGVACFVEIGPGKVLSGLVKQICREAEQTRECRVLNIEEPASLDAVVETVRS
jgi:[acyl-carrier-protein] S-malonyltransferase